MVIQEYILNLRIEKREQSDVQLEEIVSNIHRYLDAFGQNRLFLIVGKSHFQKCCGSWIKVSNHLERFLLDPKVNYSLLMSVIEHEIKRFPRRAFYGRQLVALQKLIAAGPSFNITHN